MDERQSKQQVAADASARRDSLDFVGGKAGRFDGRQARLTSRQATCTSSCAHRRGYLRIRGVS